MKLIKLTKKILININKKLMIKLYKLTNFQMRG